MFKSLITYCIADSFVFDYQAVIEAIEASPFVDIGATQEKSCGWTPARGEEHGALLESVGGQWVARFKSESKSIPASVLTRKVQEKADAIEKQFGRKPGKKEKRDLKDEVKLDLLPQAFTKISTTWIWIDPQAKRLFIDTGSQARADEIVSLLVESIKGFGVALLDTQTSAQAAMAHWLLTQEAPAGFSIDRKCKLKAADESKAVVRYDRHALDIEEVKHHIEHGKLPTELALTYDDRVSFVLTDALQIKSISFCDGVLDKAGEEGGFDTDVAIATGELSKLIPALIEALGGEGRTEIGTAPAGAASTLVHRVTEQLQKKGMTVTVSSGTRTVTINRGSVTGPLNAPADTDSASAPFDV